MEPSLAQLSCWLLEEKNSSSVEDVCGSQAGRGVSSTPIFDRAECRKLQEILHLRDIPSSSVETLLCCVIGYIVVLGVDVSLKIK